MFDGTSAEYSVKSKSIVIGRSKKCDVCITLEGFSREHCRLEIDQDELYVTDLGSSNGVFIDGKKIKPGIRSNFKNFQALAMGLAYEVQLTLEEFDLSPAIIQERDILAEDDDGKKSISRKKTVIKPEKKVPFSVRVAQLLKPVGAIAILLLCYFSYSQLKGMFFHSEEDELYKLQFEAQMKNRHKDGSVKTTDF